MKEYTICYEFTICVELKTNRGKLRRGYTEKVLGGRYEDALWSLFFTIKKRRHFILHVNSAKVLGIAWAFDREYKSVSLHLSEHTPVIPDDLNKALQQIHTAFPRWKHVAP